MAQVLAMDVTAALVEETMRTSDCAVDFRANLPLGI